ncbi:phospholipase D-like domain-containing protein [Silvibacterium sp.]|uniref:phospholipase D-like domain-containing protein n=1 Tax=Silvibacterium sp. TaxID=1964179 RepID=UPI0039E4D3A7
MFLRWLYLPVSVLSLGFSMARAQTHGPGALREFEIVESVPQATSYGEPGIRRTPTVWLEMIKGAKTSIDVAAFYITDKPGSALAPVLDALTERAASGVKVRLLVDQSFLKTDHVDVDRLRKVPGIEVRVLPADTLTGGVLHAKYMIVDDRSVFVGSQNWDWRALEQIHEIGARIDNTRFAETFASAFDFDWQIAGDPSLPKAASAAVKPPSFAPVTEEDPVLLDSKSAEPLIAFPAFSPPSLMPNWLTSEEAALVQMIHASRRELRIQVMAFSAFHQYGPKGWWTELDGAIRDAAARGVQVHIIVADWALREPMQSYLKSLAALPNITVKFSHIPEAPEGFIPYARVEHAKYAVADGRTVYIGTGNWEWSYFHTTVDASVFVQGAGPAKTLTDIFDRDWNGTYVTTLEPGKQYTEPHTH